MPDFETVYLELRAIMLAEADGLIMSRDAPGDLEIRTPSVEPRTGEPGWFGTVTIKKSYVAYHLMPLYAQSCLAEGLTIALCEATAGQDMLQL